LETSVTLDIGWFSTGRGPGSRRLLTTVHDEIASRRLDARISVVFCNRERGEDENSDLFLDQAQEYSLPLVCLSSRDFRRVRGGEIARKGESLPEWRREYDREVARRLEPYPFEIGVLAGYMLIFGDEFLRQLDLLNLHPAAPGGPKGIWQDVIWQLIDARAERAGVMMHLATPELDEGPPVTYCTYPIRGPNFDPHWREVEGHPSDEIKSEEGEANPLFAEVRRHGVARELPLVIETLRAFAERRIRIEHKRLVDTSGTPVPPFDLTDQIERAVALIADS
jgi:folate-dependent phosphoribosylglycinamide formyltransferase PurN